MRRVGSKWRTIHKRADLTCHPTFTFHAALPQDIGELYSGLYDLLAEYRPAEASDQGYLRELFHDTAMRVYGLARMHATVTSRAAGGGVADLGLLKASAF